MTAAFTEGAVASPFALGVDEPPGGSRLSGLPIFSCA